jgi:ubiquinone/menaquinone biosynthesis C-methylase UbiE
MDTGAFYDDFWRRSAVDPDADRRREADAEALIFLQIKPKCLLLEIGVGLGSNSRKLVEAGARVVAVDISFEALRRTRASVPVGTGGWIRAVQADAHRLPFRDRSFDRSAIFSVMMFLDPVGFPPELRRVMKPGARLAIVEPLAGNPFLAAWRLVVRTYYGAAAWRDAVTLIESIRRHFRILETRGYHLCPAIALIPDGHFRRALLRIEECFLASSPTLRARAWIMRIGAIQDVSS